MSSRADLGRGGGLLRRASIGSWLARALAPLVLAFPLTGLGAGPVATMGEVQLGADELRQFVEDNPQLRAQVVASEEMLGRVARERLLRRALFDEALARGWDKRAEVARRAEEARQQVILNTYLGSISQPPPGYPGEEEIKAYYESNRARLNLPQRYHLAQIFVRRPQGQAGDVDAAASRARDLAQRAQANGADFAALANTGSEDEQSRNKGGDIGWVAENRIIPEIRAAVQALKNGEVSAALASAQGWHIVKLIESRAPSTATPEEARPAVINALRTQKAQELERAHVEALLKRMPVSLNAENLSSVYSSLKK